MCTNAAILTAMVRWVVRGDVSQLDALIDGAPAGQAPRHPHPREACLGTEAADGLGIGGVLGDGPWL